MDYIRLFGASVIFISPGTTQKSYKTIQYKNKLQKLQQGLINSSLRRWQQKLNVTFTKVHLD